MRRENCTVHRKFGCAFAANTEAGVTVGLCEHTPDSTQMIFQEIGSSDTSNTWQRVLRNTRVKF